MAVYKVFPNKDATIYSGLPTINAGRDEILEVSSINNSNAIGVNVGADDIRRALIMFSDEDLQTIRSYASSSFNAKLRLYLAYASALPQNYTIECYPISQSWVMGTGKLADSPNPKNGVSWYTVDSVTDWAATGGTRSYLYTSGGGVWNATYSGSQSFDYIANKDLNLDVTSIVDRWFSGSIPNYGVVVKQASSIELNPSSSIETKFFSMDTHTIYPPCLEFKWDDSNYNTGSTNVGIISSDDFVVLSENNLGKFKEDDKYRFKLRARDRFPVRNFTTSSEYLNWKYLPPESYWAIQDYKTKEMIVDFDTNYTKVSANSTGNYFTVYMNGLQPERSYRVLVKTILPSSQEEVVTDNEIIFKVER